MNKIETFSASDIKTSPGFPLPLGATIIDGGINFSIFSRHANKVSLLLFDPDSNILIAEIDFDPSNHKTGEIWHIAIQTSISEPIYCYRMDGPFDPSVKGHYFNSSKDLLDPYAKALSAGKKWGYNGFSRHCRVVADGFDWEADKPLNIPLQDTIIYEMHVRGFTRHPSSKVQHPGTYAGIIEKIPYLKELGITAIELLPVTEFNENETINVDPTTGEQLKNFWGYSPISFFAPKASYAADASNGNHVREFKMMVKELHKAGIEIILDVVFNHTAEGGKDGPSFSFRGIDNTIYYLLDPKTRDYLNFSGCGNTLNCNHPLVRNLIIDCLHYWVIEMHVDGFRFDLASILGRDQNGKILSNPPMVEIIAEDPVLANTKIIAEAWDAAGHYQVGSFSCNARWTEWNGKYRDDVRAFMCGHKDTVSALATRIAGSSDLYQRQSLKPFNSINFVTSHDGFTLYDLVSYEKKHNLRNGENNRDGFEHNISWNSGVEGETKDKGINQLRFRRIRTFATILFLSQGVPMFNAGDEFARTQKGNNNAYCQDNSISWIDWRMVKSNGDLLRFFQMLISLRKNHPALRRSDFFTTSPEHPDIQEIIWQSTKPGRQDWSAKSRVLAFFLDGRVSDTEHDDDFFVMLNGDRKKRHLFALPKAKKNQRWHQIINTSETPPMDFVDENDAQPIESVKKVKVAPMAAVVLIAKAKID